ncbi:MAG TPA: hypothetical protein DCL21_00250, partial [Alphaproteobacteria bacterium]|nr:hypothetical protein [Alphaproteobacteria bacterium]
SDRVEENPTLDTSGDEVGFIPAKNPDLQAELKEDFYKPMPVANGYDSFSNSMVSEEAVKDQIRDLKQLDYVGFLDPNFDEALWLGVDYNYAKNKFSNFSDIKSIHMKKIVRNMLMAKARAPQTSESWLALRLKTLLEMGNLSDVKLLLKEVKPKELELLKHQELNSYYLQANMLENNTEGFIKKVLGQDPKNLNYKKSFLISLYNSGKTSQAKLTFNALTDVDKQVEISNFGKIFTALLNAEELDVAPLGKLDIFEQYLIALNSSLFTNVKYAKFADQTLLVAIENATDLSEKTMFAELLMQSYPFSYNTDKLTSVYDEHKFSSKDLSVPLNYLKNSEDEYKNRAVLYQASKISGLNSTKALSLKKLWENYSANNLGNLKFLITEKTQDISVNSSIAWFSLHLLKNELKQANLDYTTLKTLYENIDNTYVNTNIINLQIAVEFLRKTSLISTDFDSIQDYKETLNAWFKSKNIQTKTEYAYVLKVLTLLDALEAPITEEMWTKLYEKSYLESKADANPIWLRLVTASMQKEEKGKSLLLVSEKFVKNTEQTLDPQTLANIIACLNHLNMPQEMALVGMNAIVK